MATIADLQRLLKAYRNPRMPIAYFIFTPEDIQGEFSAYNDYMVDAGGEPYADLTKKEIADILNDLATQEIGDNGVGWEDVNYCIRDTLNNRIRGGDGNGQE